MVTEGMDAFAAAVLAARSALVADGGALWRLDLSECRWLGAAEDRWYASVEPAAAGFVHMDAGLAGAGVWAGPCVSGVARANTSIEWAGHLWAMIMLPLANSDDPRASTRLLVHEAMHTVESRLFPVSGGTEPRADAIVLDRATGRVWLRLELRALAAALCIGTADGVREQLGAALAFRQRRLAEATAAEADRQRCLEIREGMPEYTGRRLAGDVDADVREAVRWSEAAAGEADSSSLIRSFAYSTGPAYGFAYDRLGDGWRPELRKSLDLGSVGVQGHADCDQLARLYGVERILDEEAERDRRRDQIRAADEAAYLDGPTLRLPMGPRGITFNPQTVRSYAFGTVYADVTCRWDDAELTASEALIPADWSSIRVAMLLPTLPLGGRPGRVVTLSATFAYGERWRFEKGKAWVSAVRVESA